MSEKVIFAVLYMIVAFAWGLAAGRAIERRWQTRKRPPGPVDRFPPPPPPEKEQAA